MTEVVYEIRWLVDVAEDGELYGTAKVPRGKLVAFLATMLESGPCGFLEAAVVETQDSEGNVIESTGLKLPFLAEKMPA